MEMLKRIIGNYKMSFIKEMLADKGKNKYEIGVERWGYKLEGDYGYGFYGSTDRLKLKGAYSVNLTLGHGFYDNQIKWDSINVEIACMREPSKNYYLLNIRRGDYRTYGKVNVEAKGYFYEGEIDSSELYEIVEMMNDPCEW